MVSKGAHIRLKDLAGSYSPAWLFYLLQIHLYTQGCHSQQSLGHLSVAETEMLRDPESGQQVRIGRVLQWALPHGRVFGLLGKYPAGVRL